VVVLPKHVKDILLRPQEIVLNCEKGAKYDFFQSEVLEFQIIKYSFKKQFSILYIKKDKDHVALFFLMTSHCESVKVFCIKSMHNRKY